MMKEYRKTYKPFIAWIILFFVVLLAVGILPAPFVSGKILLWLIMAAMMLMLDALMLLIWHGEYVYWINGGPTFEQARDAGSRARKAYALAHLRAFLWATLVSLLLLTLSPLFDWPVWADITGTCAVLIIAALSTIRIKFQK